MAEKKIRSVVKAITFRVIAMALTFLVTYAFLKQADVSLGIVLVREGIATIVYFAHERAWAKVNWGLKDKK